MEASDTVATARPPKIIAPKRKPVDTMIHSSRIIQSDCLFPPFMMDDDTCCSSCNNGVISGSLIMYSNTPRDTDICYYFNVQSTNDGPVVVYLLIYYNMLCFNKKIKKWG